MSEDWVALTVATNEIEASLVGGLLDAEGIPHRRVQTMSAPGAWLTGTSNPNDPVRVMVPRDRLDEAAAVVDVPVPVSARAGSEGRRLSLWAILIAILLVALIFGTQTDAIGRTP